MREKPAGEPADALRLGKRLDLSRGRRRHTDATGDESWGGQGTGERSGAGEGGTTMTRDLGSAASWGQTCRRHM